MDSAARVVKGALRTRYWTLIGLANELMKHLCKPHRNSRELRLASPRLEVVV